MNAHAHGHEPSETAADGVVTAVSGEWAVVDVARTTGCGRCHEPGGCGGGLMQDGKPCTRSYRIANTIAARPGDAVRVTIQRGGLLRSALWMYGLPLGTALLATGSAAALWHDDGLTIAACLAGMVAGFALLRLRARGLEDRAVLGLQRR